MSGKKWKGEGSHLRSQGNETTDKAEACARRAWQCLALAGAPRVARTARDKYVAEAASLFDSARGFLTTARDAFFALARRVDAAEARKRESPAVERHGSGLFSCVRGCHEIACETCYESGQVSCKRCDPDQKERT